MRMLRSLFALMLMAAVGAASAQDLSLGTDNLSAIKGARRVAIDQFGVEFVTTLKAKGGGGGSSASVQTELQGVSDEAMQALTDQAYRETVAALTTAGFEVVDYAVLKERPEYQDLIKKTGKPSPHLVDDTGGLSKIFAPTGMPAFFQTASGDRGTMGERFTALNGAHGAAASALAKSMDLHFVRFHFLASLGTASESKGFLANFTGKARAAVQVGPTLVAKETQLQIVSQEGQRVFLTTSRTGVNGAIYLDKPFAGTAEGYAMEDTTTDDSKRSDGMANALSMGLSLLTGTKSSSTSNKTSAVKISEATFNESYGPMIAKARDAMVAKLKSGI